MASMVLSVMHKPHCQLGIWGRNSKETSSIVTNILGTAPYKQLTWLLTINIWNVKMLQKLKSQVWEFNIWQNQYNIVKFKNKIKLKKRERERNWRKQLVRMRCYQERNEEDKMSEQEQTLGGDWDLGLKSQASSLECLVLGPSLTLYRVRTLICPCNSWTQYWAKEFHTSFSFHRFLFPVASAHASC